MFVAIVALGLLAMIGLVLEGGGRLNAEEQATAIAREAARASCEQIDTDALRAGHGYVLDQAAAQTAGYDYIHRMGVSDGDVQVGRATCKVTISYTYGTSLLGLLGIHHLNVAATVSAHFVHGVTGPERI